MKIYDTFGDWWRDVGSGIVPAAGHDMEDHAHCVAYEAWCAASKRDHQTIGQLRRDYSDVLSDAEYMAGICDPRSKPEHDVVSKYISSEEQ